MATTYSYGYTVQTYVDWKQSSKTDPLAVSLGGATFDPTIYPGLIQIQAEPTVSQLATPTVTKFEVQVGFTVHYLVRVYQIKNVNGVKTYYWLTGNDVGSGLRMDFGSNSNYFDTGGSGTYIGAHTNNGSSNIVSSPSSGAVYWFSTRLLQPNTAITNYVSLNCSFTPNNFQETYGGDTNVGTITSLTALNQIPTVTVATSVPIPTYPNGFTSFIESKKEWTTAGNGGGGGSLSVVFDKCQKQWFALFIGATTYDQKTGAGVYNWATYTAGVSGDSSTYKYFSGPYLNVKQDDTKGITDAKTKIHNIILADCQGQTTGRVPAPTKPSNANVPTNTNTYNLTSDRYNPPPHIFSRNRPYMADMSNLIVGKDSKGNAITPKDIVNLYAGNNQGKIYQDPQGAAALNVNPDSIKNLAVGKGQTVPQWGFKFMYNPTTFSYTTAASNNVDWTLGSSDPSVLLQGNQSVTFELYLNRIIDMSYLPSYPKGGSDLAGVYGAGGLSEEHVQGILNRGTEYDIEFLYRVLNGDPRKNALLLDESYRGSGVTADFGYTTGMPCWLQLNDNLRYFGSVASLTVNHMIFDLRMVPVLSVINITFSRYPAIWGSTNTTGSVKTVSETAFINAVTSATSSTGTKP